MILYQMNDIIVYSIEKLYTLTQDILCYFSVALFINSQTLFSLALLMGIISLHYHFPGLSRIMLTEHIVHPAYFHNLLLTQENKKIMVASMQISRLRMRPIFL